MDTIVVSTEEYDKMRKEIERLKKEIKYIGDITTSDIVRKAVDKALKEK